MAEPLAAGVMGAAVGGVLALTGAGGGVLAVPLLVLLLHWPLTQAAPAALLAVGLAASLGALQGLRADLVRWRAALLMGGMGMVGAPLGVALGQRLPPTPLLWGFAGLMLWLAWRQWPMANQAAASLPRKLPPCVVDPGSGRLNWSSPCACAMAATGTLSGVLSGLIGVGGGFVIVPALMRYTDLDLRQIQLTSLAVIALVSASGVSSAALRGQVRWDGTLPFAAGAVLAMWLGRRWAEHLPPEVSRGLFALGCVLVSGLLVARSV